MPLGFPSSPRKCGDYLGGYPGCVKEPGHTGKHTGEPRRKAPPKDPFLIGGTRGAHNFRYRR